MHPAPIVEVVIFFRPMFFGGHIASAAFAVAGHPHKGIGPPLLRGEARDRGPIFWHYPHYGNQGGTPGSSVRNGDYKLIEFFEDDRLELYNLRDDIGEDRDLAADDPQTRDRLHAQLKAWREKVEAKIPQPNPDGSPA